MIRRPLVPPTKWSNMVLASYVEGLIDTEDLAALGLITIGQAIDIASDRDVIAANIRQEESES